MNNEPSNTVLALFAVLSMASFLGIGMAHAQPGLAWETVYQDSGKAWERGYAVAADSGNNIIVAGSSLDVSYITRFLLLKYDANGNMLWHLDYDFGGNTTSALSDVAIDSADNIIVAGYSGGNGYLAKLDSSGTTILWEIGNLGTENVFSVEVDPTDHIVISSFYRSGRQATLFVRKYDSAGSFIWEWTSSPIILEGQAAPLAIDSLGNILAAAQRGNDAYLWKIDPAGNTDWERYYIIADPLSRSIPDGIAIDPADNIFLAIRSAAMVAKFDDQGNFLTEASGYIPTGGIAVGHGGGLVVLPNIDPADPEGLRGYDGSLNPQWVATGFAGKSFEDVIFDGAGNIIVAGINNYYDVYVAKFAAAVIDPDGDGIMDSVDGYMDTGVFVDESLTYSDNFTDENIDGTSFGNIKSRSGHIVEVDDVPSPDGLLISASGGTGAAQIRACDLSPPDGRVLLTDGDSIIVTCGSLDMEVLYGPVELLLDEDNVEVVAGVGAIIQINESDDGQVQVENLSETAEVTIIVDGVSVVLGPDEHFQLTAIDILPADTTNCLNTRKKGKIPVAIFGSASLDVNQINPATCKLEEDLGVSTRGKANSPMASIKDINWDGYNDLVVQFEMKKGVIDEQTTATVTCDLYPGEGTVSGYDNICVVP
jgi:hypothetical protein